MLAAPGPADSVTRMPEHVSRHLLLEPHHDGSPTYLADEAPVLGGHVSVRVRTSTRAPATAVWLRTVEDAEPFYTACAVERSDQHTVWWRAEMHVRNPVQRYRFMVVDAEGDYVWLNQAGVWRHDVPDAHDFVVSTFAPAPDWGRDAVVYQIFPDRFARSVAADARPTPGWAKPAGWTDAPIHGGDPDEAIQLYGGDLDGIADHLDHVARVGADTLYLTPCFPAESNHRYNASTFDRIDPLLGGDEAMERLVRAVHARGWHQVGDLTSNHTGDTHEWFLRARADPSSPEHGYYYFAPDGSYDTWKGFSTLPKLDHTNHEMRHRLVEGPDSVVGRWLQPPFEVDGWRIDVANMTGRHADVDVAHDVARAIRRTATQLRPDALVLAEHGHDASGDLDGDGWHGTMNYYGFSFPVWTWLRRPEGQVPSFGLPVGVPRRTGAEAFTVLRWFIARFGWRAVGASWNILGSHDSPRIRTTTGSAERQHVAVGLQFTLPGVPMVFAGDELGLEGVDGEDSRRTMPWGSEAEWDTPTLDVYAALARLRGEHVALRRGGLRWVHLGDDLVVYLREHPEGSVLVAASRGGSPALRLPAADLGLTDGSVLYGAAPPLSGPTVTIPASATPSFAVWAL